MTSVVYFLRSESGKIKIGVTAHIKRRLGQYRTHASESVELIGCIPGGIEVEKSIHRELSEHRLNGEWFSPSADVMRKIDGLLAAGISPPVETQKEPDYYTKKAVDWCGDAVRVLRRRDKVSAAEAKKAFAKLCAIDDGTVETLLRGRHTEISAAKFEAIRFAYVGIATEELRRLRAAYDEAKEDCAA
jgi:hypothetical protein